MFQDKDTVKALCKQMTLGSPLPLAIYTFRYLFGVPEKALSIYKADNSGPFPKPYPGTQPRNRVDYITHTGLLRGLTGPALIPTTRRFMNALTRRLRRLNLNEDWTLFDDAQTFFHTFAGSALIEAIFGPSLLLINPNFVRDLWRFDAHVPWLARGLPAFLRPEPCECRDTVKNQLKNWYSYARKNFKSSYIDGDEDGDCFWGSGMVRNRQKELLQIENHDDDALAALDLGLAWG